MGKRQAAFKKRLLLAICNHCVICGNIANSPSLEHVVPKAHRGSNDISNLMISCCRCNNERGTKRLMCSNKMELILYECERDDFASWCVANKLSVDYDYYINAIDSIKCIYNNLGRPVKIEIVPLLIILSKIKGTK